MKNNIDQMSDYSDSSESSKQVDKSYYYSDSESTKPINSRKLQTRKRFSSSSSDEETF